MDSSTLEAAFDFFLPLLAEKSYINFYGGEPLLAFDRIQHAVNYIRDNSKGKSRHFQYCITTNGSLINDDILRFLNHHKFSLLLSFDGMAQDAFRKRGSFKPIVSVLEKSLAKSDIYLETNSVFTPKGVKYLSQSIQFIIELGVPNVGISPSQTSSWGSSSLVRLKEELGSLSRFILSFYRKKEIMPLTNFRKDSRKGLFSCYAGKDRMAMTPDGKLWGCHLFADCFKGKEGTEEYRRYCFGDLSTFIENHERIYPEVLMNYSRLRMDHFYTPDMLCILCEELKECGICPVDNKFTGPNMREIPLWRCKINKIFREERTLFWEELESY